ncbi:MAG: chemotaxis protein CheW [candidate division WOR-3 bacterium]
MNYFLEYLIGGIKFVTQIEEIKEITRPKDIIKSADMPRNITGFFELRGEKLPLFDLPGFLGLESKDKFEVIVSEISQVNIGFKVNKVNGIVISESIIPFPEIVRAKDYLKGVIKRDNELLQIISLNKLISKARLNSLKNLLTQH